MWRCQEAENFGNIAAGGGADTHLLSLGTLLKVELGNYSVQVFQFKVE